jgi:hypothetical protein
VQFLISAAPAPKNGSLPTWQSHRLDLIERETDPRRELDQALRRLHTLRKQRGTALEAGDQAAMTRLDEEEVSVLDDVAYAAEIVNDEL